MKKRLRGSDVGRLFNNSTKKSQTINCNLTTKLPCISSCCNFRLLTVPKIYQVLTKILGGSGEAGSFETCDTPITRAAVACTQPSARFLPDRGGYENRG
jgi:hypothetical protein